MYLLSWYFLALYPTWQPLFRMLAPSLSPSHASFRDAEHGCGGIPGMTMETFGTTMGLRGCWAHIEGSLISSTLCRLFSFQ